MIEPQSVLRIFDLKSHLDNNPGWQPSVELLNLITLHKAALDRYHRERNINKRIEHCRDFYRLRKKVEALAEWETQNYRQGREKQKTQNPPRVKSRVLGRIRLVKKNVPRDVMDRWNNK